MARYGSAAIRGHGIPEAMEQVLLNESRIPRARDVPQAALRGDRDRHRRAVRRRGADHRHRRRARLARRASSSTSRPTSARRCSPRARPPAWPRPSARPCAAVLLAVELLLFEYRPRSLIPVALAAAAATGVRIAFVGLGAGVRRSPRSSQPGGGALAVYTLLGAVIGAVAVGDHARCLRDRGRVRATGHRLGCTGCGGRRSARSWSASWASSSRARSAWATTTSRRARPGAIVGRALLVLVVLKFVSWAISLGSGTSGGTLAPLFTIGGGLGALPRRRRSPTSLPGLGIEPAAAGLVGHGGDLRRRVARAARLGGVRLRDDAPAARAAAAARRLQRGLPRLAAAAVPTRS